MKRHFLGFGVAYALGAGTVLFVESNSSCIPVSELPIPTFESTTIVGLASPTMIAEGASESTGSIDPSTVFGYEADTVGSSYTRNYQGISIKPSTKEPPSASEISVDYGISVISNSTAPSESNAKMPEPSKLDIELSKPSSLKDE